MFSRKEFAVAILALVIYITMPHPAIAQQTPPDMAIDAAARATVVDNLIKELNEGYVFADVAKKLEADLRKRQSAKEYDSISSGQAFANKLTDDLQAISKDKHLRVRFSQHPIPVRTQRGEQTEAEREQDEHGRVDDDHRPQAVCGRVVVHDLPRVAPSDDPSSCRP